MRAYNTETDYEILRDAVLNDPYGAALCPAREALSSAGIEDGFNNLPGMKQIDRDILRAMEERKAAREQRLD